MDSELENKPSQSPASGNEYSDLEPGDAIFFMTRDKPSAIQKIIRMGQRLLGSKEGQENLVHVAICISKEGKYEKRQEAFQKWQKQNLNAEKSDPRESAISLCNIMLPLFKEKVGVGAGMAKSAKELIKKANRYFIYKRDIPSMWDKIKKGITLSKDYVVGAVTPGVYYAPKKNASIDQER